MDIERNLSTAETHLFSVKKFEEISKVYVLRNEHFTSASSRFSLLSKLTFNLSKGHFDFVYELLKSKLEKNKIFIIEADSNEQAISPAAPHIKNWLQLETIAQQKFLNGKTPLILCNFIEDKWSVTLTRMLIQCGASVSKQDSTNGCQALHYACARLNQHVIDILLRNIDFNLELATDFNGNTPLVYLIVSYHFNGRFVPFRRQRRITASLLNYLNHLRRHNLSVDTINKFGYSVSDYFSMLRPDSCQFFAIVKSELDVKREFIHTEEILRRNLLIGIKELRNLRPPITRAEVADANLIFMFLKKETNSTGQSDGWKRYRDPTKLVYEYNKLTGKISLRRKWHDELRDLYSRLEIQQSPAYRLGVIQRPKSLTEIMFSDLNLYKTGRNSLVSSLNSSTRLSKHSRKSK